MIHATVSDLLCPLLPLSLLPLSLCPLFLSLLSLLQSFPPSSVPSSTHPPLSPSSSLSLPPCLPRLFRFLRALSSSNHVGRGRGGVSVPLGKRGDSFPGRFLIAAVAQYTFQVLLSLPHRLLRRLNVM